MRLGEYLKERHPHLGRTRLKQMLKFGSVRVNGRIITSYTHEVRPGDSVEFLTKSEASAERAKKRSGLDIRFEDDDVIVVDKPAGLLTMGTDDEKVRTLYFKLTEYARFTGLDARARVFIVHRLDRDTSGLVVFARNVRAKEELQKSWPQTVKKYAAVIEGVPKEPSGGLPSYFN